MSDRKMEVFKTLVLRPGRTVPPSAEPLIEGTSLHLEDVRFILAELRLRHAVSLIPAEGTLEEKGKKPGKGPAAAPAGRSETGPTSEADAEEDEFPEDVPVSSPTSRKLRSRLAKLAAQIAKMEAQDAEQNRTKRNTFGENQQSPRSKGAQGAPRK